MAGLPCSMPRWIALTSLISVLSVSWVLRETLVGVDLLPSLHQEGLASPEDGASPVLRAEPRVLLYITTHLSKQHEEYLKLCWPVAMRNVELLRKADVVVFNTGNGSASMLEELFANQSFVEHRYPNPGYQAGAILAMQELFKNGWFKGYDWVIRINPDVIIRNDTWLMETMRTDLEAGGIFVDCYDGECPNGRGRGCRVKHIHTDFVALRPSALDVKEMVKGGANAEILLGQQVLPMIKQERDRWLKGGHPWKPGWCRVSHTRETGPVAHYPDDPGVSADQCVDWFKRHPAS